MHYIKFKFINFYKSFDLYIFINIPIVYKFSNQKNIEFLLANYLHKINNFKIFCYYYKY